MESNNINKDTITNIKPFKKRKKTNTQSIEPISQSFSNALNHPQNETLKYV